MQAREDPISRASQGTVNADWLAPAGRTNTPTPTYCRLSCPRPPELPASSPLALLPVTEVVAVHR